MQDTQHYFNKWLKLYFEFKGWRYDFEVGAGKAYVQLYDKKDNIEPLHASKAGKETKNTTEIHPTTIDEEPPTQTLEEPPF